MRQIAILACAAVAGAALGQPCVPALEPLTTAFGLDDQARHSAIFDEDGAGPAPARLFLSGPFRSAAGMDAPGFARWDGDVLTPVANTPPGEKGAARVFDDGSGEAVYMAGAPGVIHRYRGGGMWDQIAGPQFSGLDGTPESFAAFDPDGDGPRPLGLHALVYYPGLSGERNSVLWRYDEDGWYRLSGPVPRGKIVAYDPDNRGPLPWEVYHYYRVERNGAGNHTGYVWRLHQDHWEFIAHTNGGMGEGFFDATVYFPDSTGVQPPLLVLVGKFHHIYHTSGSAVANSTAAWNGSVWRQVPTWFSGHSTRLTAVAGYYDEVIPKLVFAGELSSGFSSPTVSQVGWNGTQGYNPSPFGGMKPIVGSLASHLRSFDPDGIGPRGAQFIVCGAVGLANQQPMRNFAAWAPPVGAAGWKGVQETPLGNVHATAVYNDGSGRSVFAGGRFMTVSDLPVGHIARWDGERWHAVGAGLAVGAFPSAATVTALAPHFDGSQWGLYAAVQYWDSSRLLSNVARWDGQAWAMVSGQPAVPPFPYVVTRIEALASFDVDGASGPQPARLYAAGEFDSIGGVAARDIAVWNGQSWEALPGFDAIHVSSLKVLDDGSGPALYVAGNHLEVPGLDPTPLLMLTASGWRSVPLSALMDVSDVGLDNSTGTYKLTIVRSAPGGAVLSRRESPGVWTTFPSPHPFTGLSGPIRNVQEATGPALYVGTDRFDGSSWQVLGPVFPVVNDQTAAFDDGQGLSLFLGTSNYLNPSGPIPIGTVGRIRLCPSTLSGGCYANCDGSEAQPVLNASDFTCFLQRYAAGDRWANCDGSLAEPVLNVMDFTCFLQRFAAGCK